MSYFYCILGTPRVERSASGETLRFQRSPSRQFLAYLLLNNGSADKIRLCHDLEISEDILAVVISDCNRMFGKNTVKREARSVFLQQEGIATDTAQFDAWKEQAYAASEPSARARLLRSALELVRGDFLAGYADSSWAVKLQQQWQGKVAAVGITLVTLYEEQNLPREAAELIERLATLLPANPEIRVLALRDIHRHDTPLAPTKGSLAEWAAFTRQLAKDGETVTLRETKQFAQFFTVEWERLEAYRPVLKRLCILEGSFDAKLAEAVCDIDTETLTKLAELALLMETDGRFEMPPLIRDWIRSKLSVSQCTALQATYHQGIVEAFGNEAIEIPLPEFVEYWTHNLCHLEATLSHILNSPFPPTERRTFPFVVFCLMSVRLFVTHRRPDAYDYFTGLLADADTPPSLRPDIINHQGWIAISMHQYTIAAQHFQSLLDQRVDDETIDNFYVSALVAYVHSLHHSGNVSQAIELMEAFLPAIRESKRDNLLADFLNHYADALLAIGRFQEAYSAAAEAVIVIRRSSQFLPASPLYHQGRALKGMEHTEEAIQTFDEALDLFARMQDIHGQADCLQQLGKLYAQNGQFNTGKRMVEEALRMYASINKEHSRAACLSTLGDVLKRKGDIEEAEAAYREGLAFWENEVAQGRSGSGWVTHFQECLRQS